jgi:hypothetical protein
MPVHQHDPPEAMKQKVLHHVLEQIEINPRCRRHRAGKIQMMLRIAQPHQRRKQHAPLQPLHHPPHHFAQQQTIRKHRHMPPVLLQSRDRNHHRHITRESPNIRPLQFRKLHNRSLAVGQASSLPVNRASKNV